MNQKRTKTPIYFWFFSIPIFLFGLLGALQMPDVWLNSSDPYWVRTVYTLGIIGLFIGGILLILRKKIALHFFISFIVLMSTHRVYMFGYTDKASETPLAPFIPIILTILFSVFTAFISKKEWMK